MKEAGTAIEKYQPLWGSWRVEGLIGQEDGSEVYRIYKEEWGKRYISAVKLISFSIGDNSIREAQALGIDKSAMPEYFKSLVVNARNEIEMMYRLRGNSNIVTYEDHAVYEKKDGLGWDVLIRMEFLQPLPDFLAGRKLERDDAVRLGIDICKALEACAREGIIHRNIKDTSIFVTPKGEYKLGSFGMAKEYASGGRTSLLPANPIYMAPELYREQSYDFTADIYSLGMVMYKLLNRGRLPFLPLPPKSITAEDMERSIARRMAGEEPALPVDAGNALGAIILKACCYDRKERFRSPREFRQKLERYQRLESKSAGSGSKPLNETVIYQSDGKCETAVKSSEDKTELARACQEEPEGEAVSELAPTGGRTDETKKLKRKGRIAYAAVGAAVLILAFVFSYINAYEVAPVAEQPPGNREEIVQVSLSPADATTQAPDPTVEKSGEEYYREGLEHMRKNRSLLAISAFQEAKRLGYDARKADNQIKTIRKRLEVQRLIKEAEEYYNQNEYAKSIKAYEELAGIDASYGNASKYEDSFFKLAEEYNLLGMMHYNKGELEHSVKEFEKAIAVLNSMKLKLSEYNKERYENRIGIYEGNKNSVLEKIQKIDECIKSADESNRAGVKYFGEGSFKEAKLEFEKAIKNLKHIKLLAPNYSFNRYEGLVKIYEENLERTELQLDFMKK